MPVFFETSIESDATLKVFVTDIRSEADLVAYKTSSAWEATEPTVWCRTDIRGEAGPVVYFTDMKWNADLCLFWTDVMSDAEWRDGSKSGMLS